MLADFLERHVEGRTPPPLDGEVVLDLFAGTASLLVAAMMEGKVVKTYKWVDNDPSAMYIAFTTIVWILEKACEGGEFEGLANATTFAGAFAWLDVRRISADDIREEGPSAVAMGSPCQGFSRAQQQEALQGVRHPESALFYAGVDLVRTAMENDVMTCYLFENVANFANFPAEVEHLAERLPGDNSISCASSISGCYRRRFYRTNLVEVDFDDSVEGCDHLVTWGGCLNAANVVYGRETVGDHDISWHREDFPGVATNFNRFPIDPPRCGFTPFNYLTTWVKR